MIVLPPPPPHVSELRAGVKLVAGRRFATVLPDMDFETYSEAGYVWDGAKWGALPNAPQGKKGLRVVGLDVYANHPSTEVTSFYYDLKDGRGRRWWAPGLPNPTDLFAHLAAGGLIEAFNSGFEVRIWNAVCTRRYGWPWLPPLQVRCAMAKGRAWAMPPSLEEVGDVLQLLLRKDADGDRLLKKFSIPRNPTKKDPRLRITVLEDWRDDGQKLVAYNERDIVTEAEASSRIPDFTPTELINWQHDQTINQRGMAIDTDAVDACAVIVEAALAVYTAEMQALTGGIKPTEVSQLIGWLAGRGVRTFELDEEAVDELLRRSGLDPDVRRVLELRSATASASVKKVFALQHRTGPDGRMRDMYRFYGARTGRPTGEGAQPANLPKSGGEVYRCGWEGRDRSETSGCGRWHGAHTMRCPWCSTLTIRKPKTAREWNPDAMVDALKVVRMRSLQTLERFFGDALRTIAGCLRGLFRAGPGMELVSSDFTAIEGVVIACLAGEQWRIDAYANDEPMYLLSASRMFGVSVQEMKDYAKANGHHHPLRQKGKGGELGLGFGGWITALRNFDVEGTDEELKDTVLKWRAASPALEYFWGGQRTALPWEAGCMPARFGLEGMIVNAIENPGTVYPVLRRDGTPTGISYVVHDDVLYCDTPGGGEITYHRPRLHRSTKKVAAHWEKEITFEGYNTNAKKGAVGWTTMTLYGGLAAENVTQHVARNIQMHAIDQCERDPDPIPVVMHTYDEIVGEVPIGTGDVVKLERRMTNVPPWARGWPIKAAGGWVAPEYRKA